MEKTRKNEGSAYLATDKFFHIGSLNSNVECRAIAPRAISRNFTRSQHRFDLIIECEWAKFDSRFRFWFRFRLVVR